MGGEGSGDAGVSYLGRGAEESLPVPLEGHAATGRLPQYI